jgi:membrane-bound lytic murein transglycosylase B
LLLTRDEHLVAHDALGSYAGAMGMAQFIPSSYRRLAIDFDGDGQRNLWHPADAIGSIANYFHKNGWRAGEPVAFKLRAKGVLTPEPDNRNLQLSKTVRDFRRAALLPDSIKVPDDESAGLLELAQADGAEYWMALPNFQVITKYNRSILYAMAVYQLSEEINKAYALAA